MPLFKLIWSMLRRFIPGLGSPYLLAGVALAAFTAGGGLVYKLVKAAEVDDLRKQIKVMQVDSRRQEQILAKRERARVAAQQDARRWEQRWRGRLKTDETCKAWADRPLPGCVADQLFGNATRGTENVP